jgi:putative peptidoglycan binding protein
VALALQLSHRDGAVDLGAESTSKESQSVKDVNNQLRVKQRDGTGSVSDGAGTNPSVTQPGGSSTDSSGTSNQTNQSSSQDSQSKGMMRDSAGTSGTMSGDTERGTRGHKAGKAGVKQVQEALKAQGHDPGPIDGVMGPQTQEALRAYQRSQNLTETGRLDPETSEKLGVTGGMTRPQTR